MTLALPTPGTAVSSGVWGTALTDLYNDVYEGDIAAQLAGAWTTWTPILTAATTNPTNYTATGRYSSVGNTKIAQFQITAGASFTAGSGAYSLSLPVTAALALQVTAGAVRLFDNSTGNAILGARPAVNSASTLGIQTTATYAGALGNIGNAFPWVWAASDIIDGFIIFEAA